jgi:signal transduction histidine kinase
MTEQLLLLSRMEAEHLRENFKPLDLNDAVRRVIDLYQPLLDAGRLRIQLDLAPACPLRGDETLILEAVTNLFDNAAKWSPAGGTISIATSCADGDAVFHIADEGPGIDESVRQVLFERFTRDPAAPYKGTGLGLSIVSEVARLHDGRIEPGTGGSRGARFRLIFPAANLTAA